MKNLFRILAVLIICMMTLPAGYSWAAESDAYDKFTGERVAEYDETVYTFSMNNNCTYDRRTKMYTYSTSSMANSKINSNIYDGMITNDAVVIEPESKANIIVYKNGEEMETHDALSIKAEGQYKVFSRDTQIFTFTIINDKTGLISSYRMPKDFVVISALRDGEKLAYNSAIVDMSDEGTYEITYRNSVNGVTYNLRTLIDSTPPEVTFQGVKNGLAKGPVTVSCNEKKVSMIGYLNGEEFKVGKQLKKSGQYQIYAYDEVGNESSYSFRIRIYFNISAWATAALIIMAIAIITAYLIYARKHLRVR